MRLGKIVFVCGLAMANSFTTSAFAFGPVVTPDLEVFISGSSSQMNAIGRVVESMLYTPDIYYDQATNGNAYRAYFGYSSANGAWWGLKRVLVHISTNGGSIMGVIPVARAAAISRMKIDVATCTSTGAAYPSVSYKCYKTVNAVPDAGVSDVEPTLFAGSNIPVGVAALTATELGRITTFSELYAVVFGIAVSDNVPVTNLSRSQITSLLTGSYQNWNLIDPTLGSHFVRVERRGAGSGTQAAANAYFAQYPCSSGATLLADATANNPGVYEVVENSSTGNVKSGLNADFTAGKYAIGLISLENSPVAGLDHWHFVSIDSVAPTKANAIAGKYDFYVEQSIQWRNTMVNGVAAPLGNLLQFLTAFLVSSGDPAILTALPGVAALPYNYIPVMDVNGNVTNGVMKGAKSGGTCAPTQLYN